MDDERLALARRRAYALLGALLIEGLDQRRLDAVRALPALAERLPEAVDLDELAAAHYALLGHELPPFAGVFVDEEGLVGRGRPAQVVRQAHRALGVACPDDPGPDHLGQALQLMALLTDAQLEAQAHGDVAGLSVVRGWQRRVLDEALLPWMPPLHVALQGQPASLWTRVIEMAIGVLAQDGAAAASEAAASEAEGSEAEGSEAEASEDSLEALLDDPATDLRRIAGALTTTARSGVYLTRRDLEGLARRCELPRGFGGRRDMLEKLMRAAAEYEALGRLVEELRRVLSDRDEDYAALAGEPGLGVHVPGWRRRLDATRRALGRLGEAASRGRVG